MSRARRSLRTGTSRLLVAVAAFYTVAFNVAFFRNAWSVYRGDPEGLLMTGSLAVALFAVTLLVLAALCHRFTTRAVLIVLTLGGALAAYYMNRYNVVIDVTMLTNVVETDPREIADLVSVGAVVHFLLLGVAPAALLLAVRIERDTLRREVVARLKLAGVAVALLAVAVAPLTRNYASFLREHKLLRYYANPATLLYSSVRYAARRTDAPEPSAKRPIGLDAHLAAAATGRSLVVLVVGEAVRADHVSLNGYARPTFPRLAAEEVVSFTNAHSCGTATAYSVPCMFSLMTRDDFDLDEARTQEGLLDVLAHAGVHVLWRDNNSDSKGVTDDAVVYQDFRSPEVNPACDEECRDVGMLAGLDEYVAARPQGDVVVVLHQMGNHGPAYFKRFPTDLAVWRPYCRSVDIERCSGEELVNAYDNAVAYTDAFLAEVIAFLKRHDGPFRTAMFYMSDHGESLGERGLYLHGLPYLLAPDEQKHVAALIWLGPSFEADRGALAARRDRAISQDHFFHTVLGLLHVETAVHEPSLDLIASGTTPRAGA